MLRHGTDDSRHNPERGKDAVEQGEGPMWSRENPRRTEYPLRQPDGSNGNPDGRGVTLVIVRPFGGIDVAKGGVDDEGDNDRQPDEVGVNEEECRSHDDMGISSGEEPR